MSFDLPYRFRRLRRNRNIRAMVREHSISVDDLILPIFIEENIPQPVAIASMPGVFRYPESLQ